MIASLPLKNKYSPMKILLFTLITGCLGLGKMSAVAQIKPCIAIINTGNDVFKGVLINVTPDSIGLKKNAEVVFFKADEIKTIKLKELKRGFRYKKYLSYDPYNEKNYQKVSNKMVPVRKWGEKDPTIEEEISGRIITSFYNVAINGVFASIGLINGSLSNINVNYNPIKYKENAKALSYYSIAYQTNPQTSADRQELKASLSSKGN
jgi:hypothetical protein